MSIYQTITDQIIDALEHGVVPWVQPWASCAEPVPTNGVSRKPYRGVNHLLLTLRSAALGFTSNRWLTYRQALQLGGQVRRGEHGTTVVFYQPRAIYEGAGDEVTQPTVPLLRTYTVFNVGQVDGLPEEAPTAAPTWSAVEAAQQLIDATGADIRHGGGVACYVPSQDFIRMPAPGDFAYAGGYYATLLHELAHWTSAPSRCNRQLGKRFGDDAYAAEELIAELGSAFLCAHCRIDGCLQHAAYLDHWLRVLRSDKRAIFTASAAAQKAADYMLGCVPEQGTTALAA